MEKTTTEPELTQKEQLKENTRAQQDTMMRGTMWFTLADILSRLLGAIYIIPWYAWMGTHDAQANALFSMGYNIYALFLLISTAGIPVAISREVAHFNAMDDENQSFRLIRHTFLFMLGLGLAFAIVMYLASPWIADVSGGGDELIPVMRSLSLSILIFPAMSVIRGFFQGLNDMKPIALSQIYEQVVRVIWMLTFTFMIMKIGLSGGNWIEAVTQSTTAAFIGMLGSCIVLGWFLVKNKLLGKLINPGPTKSKIRAGRMLTQTLWQAIPFVVIGSAIQIFKIIDQVTFSNVMHMVTNYSNQELQVFFAYFSANTDKLTMILIGEAMTLGAVALPLITSNFVKKNYKETSHLISYDFQLFVAFMLPAIMGMVLLARPIYTLFYNVPNHLQLALFIFAVIQSLLLALYTMVAPILQALHYSRVALKYFIYTLLVKLVLQVPMILIFKTYGPLTATTIAFIFGCWIIVRKIHQVTGFRVKGTMRGITGIAILTAIMMIITLVLEGILSLILMPLGPGRLKAILEVFIAGGVGFFAYIWMAAKLGLLEKLLGTRGTSLRRRLRI
ncbi:putative polysaccharide biosynthesis protein [Lactococcus termiticola]|uniref:Polysaccharide transport membrane protein n=1 Tax=Lactococcus termiticola TaxID=2169526 RepID=A0A2R5HKF9_9LACT|nr:polysaccharide biosynthesis protein [Lactococcus termiticola]GBG97308.1 polysaccharide transport membrane protein [Lactococcus termiticola]